MTGNVKLIKHDAMIFITELLFAIEQLFFVQPLKNYRCLYII